MVYVDWQKITEEYYCNNAEKLRKVVDSIIKKYGGIYGKDMDDFYSLAGEVFWLAVNDFNGKGAFDGYFYFKLQHKIMSLITLRNREKRADIEKIVQSDGSVKTVYHPTLSLDSSGEDGVKTDIINFLASKNTVEGDVIKEPPVFSKKTQIYLSHIPRKAKKVLMLIGDNYNETEICEELHITMDELSKLMRVAQSYEYKKLLM